jgi:predicted dehydrogenase
MRVVVVGLGNQGKKRLSVAGNDDVATVDPIAPQADYASIKQVPLDNFDAALVCTSDQAKIGVLTYVLTHGKHVLVEKPLLPAAHGDLQRLHGLAQSAGVTCYTAYNHRFEPNLLRLKEIVDSDVLGPIYLAHFYYGNGTAADVRSSPWRDSGCGVLTDLGSHLLDLVAFLLGRPQDPFRVFRSHRFENQACDSVLFGTTGTPALTLEASLVSWKNSFRIDLTGANGSAHVDGLCKWGPSFLRLRRRVLPSGKPTEEIQGYEKADPTWAAEYAHFQALCRTGETNLGNDIWIASVLNNLAKQEGVTQWAA